MTETDRQKCTTKQRNTQEGVESDIDAKTSVALKSDADDKHKKDEDCGRNRIETANKKPMLIETNLNARGEETRKKQRHSQTDKKTRHK